MVQTRKKSLAISTNSFEYDAMMKQNQKENGVAFSAVAMRRHLQAELPTTTQVKNGSVNSNNQTSEEVSTLPLAPRQSKKRKLKKEKAEESSSLFAGTGSSVGSESSTPEWQTLISEDSEEEYVRSHDSNFSSSESASGPAPVYSFSTFKASPATVVWNQDLNTHLFKIKAGETLTLLGQYEFRILQGGITHTGATLRSSPTWYQVYCPSTHSLPCIMGISDGGPGLLESSVEVRALHSGLVGLKQLSPLFAHIWDDETTDDNLRGAKSPTNIRTKSYSLLQTSADAKGRTLLAPLLQPEAWNTLLSETCLEVAKKRRKVLICGPQASGKSTFVRLLVNGMLTAYRARQGHDNGLLPKIMEECGVALLDLDPGQPEFSAPSQISLLYVQTPIFGPPFSHPIAHPLDKAVSSGVALIRAHSLCATTPKDDPFHYIASVTDLILHYQQLVESRPGCSLVINCPGWIQGLGLEIIKDLIKQIDPATVIYMSIKGPEEVVQAIKEASSNAKFRELPSQPIEQLVRSQKDLRVMQSISYFHSLHQPQSTSLWNNTPLLEKQPVIVKYAGKYAGIFGIIVLEDEALEIDQLFDLINGSIVTIVVAEADSAFFGPSKSKAGFSSRLLEDGTTERSHAEHEDDEVGVGGDEIGFYTSLEDLIQRTKEGLPHLRHMSPLHPRRSYTVGLALIRAIDTTNKELQLLTPVSLSSLQHISSEGNKIVLVRGKLDTPTWAYMEAMTCSCQKRKEQRAHGAYDPEALELEELRDDIKMKKSTPLINVREAGEKRRLGEGVWRLRKNKSFTKKDAD